jgi:hypothetical protein
VFGVLGILLMGLLIYCCWPGCFEPVALLDTDQYVVDQDPVPPPQQTVYDSNPPTLLMPIPRPVLWRPFSWQNGFPFNNF